ncbi:MAG: hypothetical protein ACSLE1_15860 [Sphingobium sp.]
MTQDDFTFTLPREAFDWKFWQVGDGDAMLGWSMTPAFKAWLISDIRRPDGSLPVNEYFEISGGGRPQSSVVVGAPKVTFTTVEDATLFKLRWQ